MAAASKKGLQRISLGRGGGKKGPGNVAKLVVNRRYKRKGGGAKIMGGTINAIMW